MGKKLLLSLLNLFGLILLIVLMSSCGGAGAAQPTDLSIPNLKTKLIVPQMMVNHSSVVMFSLISAKEGTPISALDGSLIDRQTAPLSTLLGDAPCATASLPVDPAAFNIDPSQPQEHSLQQSEITWVWNVTPLNSTDVGTQQIFVDVNMAGKTACDQGLPPDDSFFFPTQEMSFQVLASDTSTTSSQGNGQSSTQTTDNPQLGNISIFLILILFTILLVGAIQLIRKKQKEIKSSHILRIKHTINNGNSVVHINNNGTRAIQKPLSLFYCYVSPDTPLRDELHKHLSSLEHAGWIKSWFDGMIEPGTVREEEIRRNLETANIILLLVSSDFIASSEHYGNQMKRAIERHKLKKAVVIPIILRPCLWEKTSFASLQPLPSKGEPVTLWSSQDAAFLDIAQGVNSVIDSHFQKEAKGIVKAD